MSSPSRLLRFALIADAAASGAMGTLLTAGAGLLSSWLALPQTVLFYTGLFLIAYAAAVAWTGTRPQIPRPAAWLIAGINLVWVAESFGVMILDILSPNGWGVAFISAQALAVLALAALQIAGLRRSRSVPA